MCATSGEVAEWSNAPDLKSGDSQGSVGSNPTLSVSDNFMPIRWRDSGSALGLARAGFIELGS